MKIDPIVFEILVLSNNLALSKYQDRVKKEGLSVVHPSEYDIMDLAVTFLDFLKEHSEVFSSNGENNNYTLKTQGIHAPSCTGPETYSSTGPTGMESPETDTNNLTV